MPEQTSGPSWTPEDVELVARASQVDGLQWDMLCAKYPAAADSIRRVAEKQAAALAEAGRLREPGDEEWGYRCDAGCEHTHAASEREARSLAAGRRGALVRRWVGPWLPVEATDEDKISSEEEKRWPTTCGRCYPADRCHCRDVPDSQRETL